MQITQAAIDVTIRIVDCKKKKIMQLYHPRTYLSVSSESSESNLWKSTKKVLAH